MHAYVSVNTALKNTNHVVNFLCPVYPSKRFSDGQLTYLLHGAEPFLRNEPVLS